MKILYFLASLIENCGQVLRVRIKPGTVGPRRSSLIRVFSPQPTTYLIAALLVLPLVSQAGIGNVCTSGTCDIATPVYVNVYWDANPSTWNADVTVTDKTMTQNRIDALTGAIVHSGYFQPLSQYNILDAKTAPSLTDTSCASVPPTIQKAKDAIGSYADCIMGLIRNTTDWPAPQVAILNVFLPPQTAPSAADKWCAGAGTTIGEHDQYGSSVEITINPTNAACNPTIAALSSTLSHEMVEAATDPSTGSISGWKKPFWEGGGEIADLCPLSSSFMYGLVNQYWSNDTNSCFTGIVLTPPAPSVDSFVACGVGQDMKLTLLGNFHAMPWDLSPTGIGRQTMFLQLFISRATQANWRAGNIEGFPPDVVGFGGVTWLPDGSGIAREIDVSGFDAGYGAKLSDGSASTVAPGDTIIATVWSPLTGASTTSTVVAPSPFNIVPFAIQPGVVFTGAATTISGTVIDSRGCPEGAVSVALNTNAGTLTPSTVQTDSQGKFSVTLIAGSTAGRFQVTAQPFQATQSVQVLEYVPTVTGGIDLPQPFWTHFFSVPPFRAHTAQRASGTVILSGIDNLSAVQDFVAVVAPDAEKLAGSIEVRRISVQDLPNGVNRIARVHVKGRARPAPVDIVGPVMGITPAPRSNASSTSTTVNAQVNFLLPTTGTSSDQYRILSLTHHKKAFDWSETEPTIIARRSKVATLHVKAPGLYALAKIQRP